MGNALDILAERGNYELVLITVPDKKTGTELSEKLLTARLAACVTVMDGASSAYWWEGKIQHVHGFLRKRALCHKRRAAPVLPAYYRRERFSRLFVPQHE